MRVVACSHLSPRCSTSRRYNYPPLAPTASWCGSSTFAATWKLRTAKLSGRLASGEDDQRQRDPGNLPPGTVVETVVTLAKKQPKMTTIGSDSRRCPIGANFNARFDLIGSSGRIRTYNPSVNSYQSRVYGVLLCAAMWRYINEITTKVKGGQLCPSDMFCDEILSGWGTKVGTVELSP